MADLADGEEVEVQGSASKPYVLKNTGGVFSCTCPAWRNQGVAIERRTCKHLRKLRGDAVETARVGASGSAPVKASKPKSASGGSASSPSSGNPPALLLAHTWENDVDLVGWWMSEKLDGVRAYWDGSTFWSRLGNEFFAPEWFTETLPKTPLDGELFVARKKFQRTVSIVRRQDRSDEWKQLAYHVFDAPSVPGPFETRLAKAKTLLADAGPYGRLHPHEECQGVIHLRAELARVEALGGEGLMLRKPGSLYEPGRSSTLLKVKSFKDDEAVVLGYTKGLGKHTGKVGALEVQLASGVRFSVGTGLSDKERASPPPIGTLITFRYQELSDDGVPRFPSYVGVAIDKAAPGKKSKP